MKLPNLSQPYDAPGGSPYLCFVFIFILYKMVANIGIIILFILFYSFYFIYVVFLCTALSNLFLFYFMYDGGWCYIFVLFYMW